MSETQLERVEIKLDRLQSTLSKFVDHVQGKLLEHDDRFDQIDSRFDQVDRRMDNLAGEMTLLRREMNQRFDAVDGRLVELERA